MGQGSQRDGLFKSLSGGGVKIVLLHRYSLLIQTRYTFLFLVRPLILNLSKR